MTTVFLSGSRRLSRLNQMIRSRLDNIIRQQYRVVIGDANGADKALQSHLSERNYRNVTVYCSGDRCRNNVGDWPTRKIEVDPGVKGREFYMAKDKAMANEADYGLILWDGESIGAFGNLIELAKRGSPTVVYLSTNQSFYQVSNLNQANRLLQSLPVETVNGICRKLKLNPTTLGRERREPLPQSAFPFDT